MLWWVAFVLGLAWFAAMKLGFDRLIEQRMGRVQKRLFRVFLMGSFFALWVGLAAVIAELVSAGHWVTAAALLAGLTWVWRRLLRRVDRRGLRRASRD